MPRIVSFNSIQSSQFNLINISVIADFGGLLGLFMGCSVLSIVEIFYFAFLGLHSTSIRVIQKFYAKKSNENACKIVQVLPASSQIRHTSNEDILASMNSLAKSMQKIYEKLREIENQVTRNEEKIAKIENFQSLEKEKTN
jgi:hypothetical protein